MVSIEKFKIQNQWKKMLITTSNIFQIVIALGLLNVWILRFNKETAYRGGIAKTLKEEFVAYDLPVWSCYAVGFLKILSAILLIVGVWIPQIVLPSSILVLFLMFAAVKIPAGPAPNMTTC